jgi:hypothetical protein
MLFSLNYAQNYIDNLKTYTFQKNHSSTGIVRWILTLDYSDRTYKGFTQVLKSWNFKTRITSFPRQIVI